MEYSQSAESQLHRSDYVLIGLFSFFLFGYGMVGGRPLTMHEAIVPESACEMLADHDWIVPKSGGRPWLEKPPLPQWITAMVAKVVGRCDREWIVRLSPALIGSSVVLLLSWMASIWFGRSVGLLSGFILATMFEFIRYAWLAEADIFLCGLVTSAIGLFVYQEFARPEVDIEQESSFLGKRPWPMMALFVIFGLTSLAKGPLFGTVMSLLPIFLFLILNNNATQINRYVWFWGWIAFILITAAWPLAAWHRYPDVIDLWTADYLGRISGSFLKKPIWYYPVALAWEVTPWTLPIVSGLWLSRKKAFHNTRSPERFLWCWAILPIIVLSIPDGKHHHYLLSCLPPWAVLGAIGLLWMRDAVFRLNAWMRTFIPGLVALFIPATLFIGFETARAEPAWTITALMAGWMIFVVGLAYAIFHRNARLALGTLLVGLAVAYCWGYTHIGLATDQTIEDTVFFRDIRTVTSTDKPILVNADLDSMDLFRILFYLRALGDQVLPIHNLTFLLDDRILNEEVYLVTRRRDLLKLSKLGIPEVLLQSRRTRRERSPDDRFALFYLRFHKDLHRKPAPSYISPMQATAREDGPYIGSPLE